MICCYCDAALSCSACGHEMPEEMGLIALDAATKWKARSDALAEALTDLIEAVRRDSDEGGKGISGYTAARLSDARDALASVGTGSKP